MSFMLKKTCKSLQVCLSIYHLLLKPDIKELSMKEITMHLSDQNYKCQLNLILFFFQVPSFVRILP